MTRTLRQAQDYLMTVTDAEALARELPDQVEMATSELAWAAQDFGGIVRRVPRAVVRPTSVEGVVTAVSFCARHRIPLAVRGTGLTSFGQSLCADGIVLELGRLSAPPYDGDGDTIWLGAGERWSQVVDRTLLHGVTVPVLPDYLRLSVGGTLSLGGIGENSFSRGLQSDHVVRLEVVTGAGERLRCSRDERPELFDACRAGFGQCAVIVAAEMKLEPAPAQVTMYNLRCPDHRALLREHRRLAVAGDFDYLQSSVDALAPGSHVHGLNVAARHQHAGDAPAPPASSDLEVRKRHSLSYEDYLFRLDNLEPAMRELGVWDVPHPWAYFAVPESHGEAFLGAALEALQRRRDGRIMGSLFAPSRCSSPLYALPDGEHALHFALLRHAIPPTRARVDALLESNRRLWRATAAIGGRFFAAGAVPLTPDDWRLQLGDRWEPLRAAKERYDPAQILGRGYRIFT